MNNKHPQYNCENCGITHPSYSDQKELKHKNKKTRNILIIIAIVSLMMIPTSVTVFDLVKEPSMIKNDISVDSSEYDLVCVYDLGMQYCLISYDGTNYVKYNSEKLVLQSKDNPCLDLNLKTSEKTVDFHNVVNGTDCVSSLEFPINNDWYWKEYQLPIDKDGNTSSQFEVVKSKQWWDRSNCPEELDENFKSKGKSFCNWWLEL
jgi:hypothetical protein